MIATIRRCGIAASRSLGACLLLGLVSGTAHADLYDFSSVVGSVGGSNTQLDLPGRSTVDTVHGRLLVADSGNARVQIFDSATLAYVGTIGVSGVPGSDDAHLDDPVDVGFDAANDRILVADQGNFRIQLFDAASLAYVATIGVTGVPGGDNAHFGLPVSVKVNEAFGQVYVADSAEDRVQIFSAKDASYLATLGTAGVSGADSSHLSNPADAEYDAATNQIMVADLDNARIQLYDALTLAPRGQIGVTGEPGADNAHFNLPISASFDPTSGLVLVADSGTSNRVQVFSAATYRYLGTLGVLVAGVADGHFTGPIGASADPINGRLFVVDQQNSRVQAFAAIPSPLVASVLPGARSVALGATPTIFATMLNAGGTALSNCGVALPASAPSGLAVSYQTTNPATNTLTGTKNAPAALAAAPVGSPTDQSFVLTFNSPASFAETGQPLEFACDGVAPATLADGVNTVDLMFSASPVADVIALAATAQQDGIVHVPAGNAGAFAVASINIGVAANLTVAVDTGNARLPLSATVCETAANGQCMAPPSASLPIAYASGATPTFSVFVTTSAAIPLAPATARIFLRFLDGNGISHGATSVAVATAS